MPAAETSGAVATGSSGITDAVQTLGRLAQVHDRPELVEACDAALRRLALSRFRIVVMGEFKRGKSSLINALVDAPVCAVDDDIATAARMEIADGDPPSARCWSRSIDMSGRVERAAEIVEDIPVTQAAEASTRDSTRLVRVVVPRRVLRRGVVLVDTPGIGGVASAASVVTASSLAEAHAVLFVSDASQELTRPERDALADAAQRCGRVYLVETKIDLYPHWSDIVRADRKHVDDLGLDASIDILPVSSVLRQRALRTEDAELNTESGFADLVRLVAVDLPDAARQIVDDGALQTARRTYHLLRQPLVAEIEVLEGGGRGGDVTEAARLAVIDAQAAIGSFKERVAGWQQVLGDGMADLAAAVDVDLRDRLPTIVGAADEMLDAADPDDVWDEFEPGLYRSTAEALDANLTLLREHADALAVRLAEAIADDEEQLVPFDGLRDELDLGEARRRADEDASAGARAQQAFRAGYGGAMPIMAVGGMALGVLGLGTLVLPLAAVAGVMAGRKALTDERERRLGRRRQQAKAAVKKYTDEAMMRASVERKQAQRSVQRALRDHCVARVKELAAVHQLALDVAERAVQASVEERRRRLADVRAELARVERVAIDLADAR